ncbi:MAG TPA: hypothetical protein VMS65_06770 [Polyangiaceae bacterium]|nr:hypothetical protein [Polyangiaceae bacterium]
MSDTPAPDPEDGTNAVLARRDRPGSRSFPLVMAVFAGLLALGVLVGIAIHRRYIAFERIVAQHVPDDAALAVRWDVEKVTLFEPTRRFLLPLLDETPTTDLDPGDRSRRRRLARQGGLELGRDLREALVVFGPQPGDWAVVAGGAFPKSGVADAVERVLRDEGRDVRRIGDERLETPDGIAFGRADDGVLVVASSAKRLDSALAVRAPNESIPRTGAGAFFARDAGGLPGAARDALAELGDVSHVEGVATWGTPLVVDITVHYRGRPPGDAVARARRVLGALLGPGPVPAVELVSEAATTVLRVRLDDDALGRAVRRAGDSVHGTLWRTGRKSAAP